MSGSRTIVVDSATPETMVTALIDNESRYINGVVYIQDDGTWTPVTFSRDLDWADIRSFARAAGWTWQIGWLPGGVWGVWRAPTNDGHSEARVTFRGRSEVEVSGPLPGPFCRLANPTPKAVLEVAFVAVYVAAAGGRKEWAA